MMSLAVRLLIRCACLAAGWVLFGCSPDPSPVATGDMPIEADLAAPARWVGAQSCAGCHAAQFAAWQQSHHAHAMAEAAPDSVLGDFSGLRFDYAGGFAQFFMRAGEFWVRTNDYAAASGGASDAAPAEFQILYTFGFAPLQQYLVATDDGRLQALNIAWDSRPAADGGQRWFDLYEGDALALDDPLHWASELHNWNSRCAACHSTVYEKRYDATADEYASTFSGVNVDCEACHGPASEHVEDPVGAPLQLASTSGEWVFSTAPIAQRTTPAGHVEIETCAACHSRRAQFADLAPGAGLFEVNEPALLQPELYYADGQIKDEVFVWGSFTQSAMYAAGVTCSDCHDPHSGALHRDGDALCSGCHRPDIYAVPAHHRHPAAQQTPACVDCHMPATTYMGVDPRRDHSLRVPRPDLSVSIDVPNACANCHADVPAQRLAAAVADWFPAGRASEPHYGEALAAARAWTADRRDRLVAVLDNMELPQIARATALGELVRQPDGTALDAIEAALAGDEPQMQLAALRALENASADLRLRLAQRFLNHPILGMRIAAVRSLLDMRAALSQARRADFDAALAEYQQSHEYNADSVEGRHGLGVLRERLGDADGAEAAYRSALELEPGFAPAYVNLADLLRRNGREAEGVALLDRAVASDLRGDPSIRTALGFAYVRSGNGEAALAEFAAAVEASPDDPYLAYANGLALDSLVGRAEALAYLEAATRRFPGYAPTLFALATMHRDGGDSARALALTDSLLEVSPGDANGLSLRAELRSPP